MIELDVAAGAAPTRVAIAAFDGWNDAADAATSAVTHLAGVWQTRALGHIEPDDYYDFQVNRPTVSVGTERPVALIGPRRPWWNAGRRASGATSS